jgi:hypothetical protein
LLKTHSGKEVNWKKKVQWWKSSRNSNSGERGKQGEEEIEGTSGWGASQVMEDRDQVAEVLDRMERQSEFSSKKVEWS